MARGFKIYKNKQGIFAAEILNPETGERVCYRSTMTKKRDDALIIISGWLKDGIPKRRRGRIPVYKKPVAETLEAVSNLAGVLKIIEKIDINEDQAMKIVNALKKRGFVNSAVSAASKGNQKFIDFLNGFWDYEKSVYLRDKRAHGKSTTLRHCQEAQRAVNKYYKPFFGDKPLSEVTRADLREFGLRLSEEHKLAAKTINSKLHISTTALKWAYFEKIIPEYITQGLGGFIGEEKKRNIFTDDEIMKLDDIRYWENKKCYAAYRLAGTSALRSGEIRALRRQDIGEGILHIRHSYERLEGLKKPKNNKTRTVYLLPSVRALLLELLEENPVKDTENQYVFFSDVNPEIPTIGDLFTRYLHRAIKNTDKICAKCSATRPPSKWDCSCGQEGNKDKSCAKCGIPRPVSGWECSCGHKNTGINTTGRRLDFHSLRHYVLTKWANGEGVRVAQKVGGHLTEAQTAHYADHVEESEMAAMGKKAANIFPFRQAV